MKVILAIVDINSVEHILLTGVNNCYTRTLVYYYSSRLTLSLYTCRHVFDIFRLFQTKKAITYVFYKKEVFYLNYEMYKFFLSHTVSLQISYSLQSLWCIIKGLNIKGNFVRCEKK